MRATPIPMPEERALAPAGPTALAPVDPLAGFFWSPDEEAPELGLAVAPAAVLAPAVEAERWLAFRLGGEAHAAPLGPIRELRPLAPITEVPRAPFGVLGVTSVRGEILPVVDPRLLLGFPATPPGRAARVVIVDVGRGPVGLLVEAIDGVRRLAPADIEAVPAGLAAPGELLLGVGRHEGRLLALLDLPALLVPVSPPPAPGLPAGRPPPGEEP